MKKDKKPSVIEAILKSAGLTATVFIFVLLFSRGFEDEAAREVIMYFFGFVVLLITFANCFISDIRYKEDLKQRQLDRELAQKNIEQAQQQRQQNEEKAQKRHEEMMEALKELRREVGSRRRRR